MKNCDRIFSAGALRRGHDGVGRGKSSPASLINDLANYRVSVTSCVNCPFQFLLSRKMISWGYKGRIPKVLVWKTGSCSAETEILL